MRSNWVAIKTGFRKSDCHKPRTDQQIVPQQSNAPAEASTNYGKFGQYLWSFINSLMS